MSIYVTGSEAVQFDEVPQRRVRTDTRQERETRRKKRDAVRRKQTVRKKYFQARKRAEQAKATEMSKVKAQILERKMVQKRMAFTLVAGIVCTGLLIISAASLIGNVSTHTQLKNQIRGLENSYDELKTQNDSKEFDINNFVDLNAVKRIATEELGMVRSSADQIVYYQNNNSEYIQQVADGKK